MGQKADFYLSAFISDQGSDSFEHQTIMKTKQNALVFRKTHTIILHNYIYKKLIIWAHDRMKTLVKHGPELSRRLLHPNFYTAGGRLDVLEQ